MIRNQTCGRAELLDVRFAAGGEQQRVVSQLTHTGWALHRQATASRPNGAETEVQPQSLLLEPASVQLLAAGSSRGNKFSVSLTRSTSLPKRQKARASSHPTGPLPMTTSSLGGSSTSEKTLCWHRASSPDV
jgi:hypothetical protein